MHSINIERDLKSILTPGEFDKIVIVIINNGVLNVEVNKNHEGCCGKEGSSVIHFGPRFCAVNLHKGVDQKEISKCKQCKTVLSRTGGNASDEVAEQDKDKKEEKDVVMEDKVLMKKNKDIVEDLTVEENKDLTEERKDLISEEKDLIKKQEDMIKEKEELVKEKKDSIKEDKDIINSKIDSVNEKKDVKMKAPIKKKKAFSCDICKKRFKSEFLLKTHILIKHLKEKRFTCNWCNKAFLTEIGLKSHKRAHRNEDNSYICDRCGKMFKWSGQLKYHMQYTHLKKNKRFTCPRCKKTFCTRSTLQFHKQIHTQFNLWLQ